MRQIKISISCKAGAGLGVLYAVKQEDISRQGGVEVAADRGSGTGLESNAVRTSVDGAAIADTASVQVYGVQCYSDIILH